MPKLTHVSLRLPIEVVERLSELARKTGRSRTFYMQKAIELSLVELERTHKAEKDLLEKQDAPD